jgi:CRISPR-associated endonuclease Csy4
MRICNCKEVRFKRNQSIAKIFVGESRRRLKRLEKRALARGEIFSPKKSSYSRELNLFHRIPISSSSNHNDFILHIQKENVDCISEPNFSGYGFASNNKFHGTVPDLSTLIEF